MPHLAARVRPPRLTGFRGWSAYVDDPQTGAIQLRGSFAPGDGETAVLLVHGLGGGLESPYMLRAAAAVSKAGLGCLMLAVRGAERAGEDFYHAGQTADIEAALRSPELRSYKRILVVGFSLGGHMSLRLGLNPPDNVDGITAVCAPLDLARSAAAIDAPKTWVYRSHILRGLKEIYREVASRREVPTPLPLIERVRTIREWDRLTVVPRYGFGSVDDYYANMSSGPRLRDLKVRTLIVSSDADPMVPAHTVVDSLRAVGSNVTVRRVDAGGHVGFPDELDLDLPGERGLIKQVLGWFAEK